MLPVAVAASDNPVTHLLIGAGRHLDHETLRMGENGAVHRAPRFSVAALLFVAALAAAGVGAIGTHLSTASPGLPGPVTVRPTGSLPPLHAVQSFGETKDSTGSPSGGGQLTESPEQPEHLSTVLPKGAVSVIPRTSQHRREAEHQNAGTTQSGDS